MGLLDGIIVVGAFDNIEDMWGSTADVMEHDSNRGSCVDVLAPGGNIRAATAGTACGFQKESGASQAAPFAAGVAAQILQGGPGRSPADVEAILLDLAVKNKVDDVPSATPNRAAAWAGR